VSIQPDLFGDYDRAQEQAQRWRQPATCGYLLRQNHGADPDQPGICGFPPGEHPNYAAMCVAQYLVRNHIIHATRTGNAEQLTRDKTRGRQLGLDVDAIEATAREETRKKNKGPTRHH
jgi:hypothetical protein